MAGFFPDGGRRPTAQGGVRLGVAVGGRRRPGEEKFLGACRAGENALRPRQESYAGAQTRRPPSQGAKTFFQLFVILRVRFSFGIRISRYKGRGRPSRSGRGRDPGPAPFLRVAWAEGIPMKARIPLPSSLHPGRWVPAFAALLRRWSWEVLARPTLPGGRRRAKERPAAAPRGRFHPALDALEERFYPNDLVGLLHSAPLGITAALVMGDPFAGGGGGNAPQVADGPASSSASVPLSLVDPAQAGPAPSGGLNLGGAADPASGTPDSASVPAPPAQAPRPAPEADPFADPWLQAWDPLPSSPPLATARPPEGPLPCPLRAAVPRRRSRPQLHPPRQPTPRRLARPRLPRRRCRRSRPRPPRPPQRRPPAARRPAACWPRRWPRPRPAAQQPRRRPAPPTAVLVVASRPSRRPGSRPWPRTTPSCRWRSRRTSARPTRACASCRTGRASPCS